MTVKTIVCEIIDYLPPSPLPLPPVCISDMCRLSSAQCHQQTCYCRTGLTRRPPKKPKSPEFEVGSWNKYSVLLVLRHSVHCRLNKRQSYVQSFRHGSRVSDRRIAALTYLQLISLNSAAKYREVYNYKTKTTQTTDRDCDKLRTNACAKLFLDFRPLLCTYVLILLSNRRTTNVI